MERSHPGHSAAGVRLVENLEQSETIRLYLPTGAPERASATHIGAYRVRYCYEPGRPGRALVLQRLDGERWCVLWVRLRAVVAEDDPRVTNPPKTPLEMLAAGPMLGTDIPLHEAHLAVRLLPFERMAQEIQIEVHLQVAPYATGVGRTVLQVPVRRQGYEVGLCLAGVDVRLAARMADFGDLSWPPSEADPPSLLLRGRALGLRDAKRLLSPGAPVQVVRSAQLGESDRLAAVYERLDAYRQQVTPQTNRSKQRV